MLSLLGAKISKNTPKDNVRQLIKNLHPVKTQFDLIRIGPNRDGGYLVPNDMEGIVACFSPGVGPISEFEKECIEKFGLKVFMADRSVDGPELDAPKSTYSFIKKFIGCVDNEEFITMDRWVDSSLEDKSSDLILQMDIEGWEYYSLLNMSTNLINRFRIMIIEFHFLEKLWEKTDFELFSTVFNKVLETHFCVHIHPNNYAGVINKYDIQIPKLAEFTFLRKDRGVIEEYQRSFPHKLDFSNVETVVDLTLSENWYRNK